MTSVLAPGRRTRLAASIVAAALLLAALPATAAPTAQDKNAAKSAWTQGKKLQQLGKDDEAVVKLREAVERDPKAQYQLDLARALVKANGLVEAKAVARAVMETKEANAQRAKQAAAQLLKEIEPKIPSLKITIKGAADPTKVTATVDGETVEIGKDLEYDPGSYTVKARSEDAPEVTERVELTASQHRTVELDLAKKSDAKATGEKKEKSGGNMAPAAVLYSIGGAGIAVGAVLGVLAFQQTSKVEDLCGGRVCPPEYEEDVALAQDYGTGSTIGFAIGGLCVAAGIILTVTVGISHGDDDEKKKADAAWVLPAVSPGFTGVVGGF